MLTLILLTYFNGVLWVNGQFTGLVQQLHWSRLHVVQLRQMCSCHKADLDSGNQSEKWRVWTLHASLNWAVSTTYNVALANTEAEWPAASPNLCNGHKSSTSTPTMKGGRNLTTSVHRWRKQCCQWQQGWQRQLEPAGHTQERLSTASWLVSLNGEERGCPMGLPHRRLHIMWSQRRRCDSEEKWSTNRLHESNLTFCETNMCFKNRSLLPSSRTCAGIRDVYSVLMLNHRSKCPESKWGMWNDLWFNISCQPEEESFRPQMLCCKAL